MSSLQFERERDMSNAVSLAYKRPVVYGLKSVFSGFKKLYGLTNP
jgi:hypothetical protein